MTLNPSSSTTASMTSRRRSRRGVSACIGYNTTVPSSWKLTQLLGNMASGFGGCGVSSHRADGDALAPQGLHAAHRIPTRAARLPGSPRPGRCILLVSAVSGL